MPCSSDIGNLHGTSSYKGDTAKECINGACRESAVTHKLGQPVANDGSPDPGGYIREHETKAREVARRCEVP